MKGNTAPVNNQMSIFNCQGLSKLRNLVCIWHGWKATILWMFAKMEKGTMGNLYKYYGIQWISLCSHKQTGYCKGSITLEMKESSQSNDFKLPMKKWELWHHRADEEMALSNCTLWALLERLGDGNILTVFTFWMTQVPFFFPWKSVTSLIVVL